MSTRLVSDVGGTNARFALFDEEAGLLRHVSTLKCGDFPAFPDAVEAYLAHLEDEKPRRACLAVAGVQAGNHVRLTNMDWCFSPRDIQARFGFHQLRVVNDFVAVGMALPRLHASDLFALTPGLQVGAHDLLAFGPGTGLGGAHWHSGAQITPCEPGHAGLSPATELELEIFTCLLPARGEISAELLLSGPGLLRLYETLATIRDEPALLLSAAQISAAAVQGNDPLALMTVEVFCALLGSAAGDFTVSTGAYGGVFLAGGMLAHLTRFLEQSDFLKRFVSKGAMDEHLRKVPVNVIQHPYPGLLGAGLWPLDGQ